MSRARKILTDSVTLGVRQTAALVLTVVQTVVAAYYLRPEGFGTFAIVSIATMMASLCTPGFLTAAYRELPHYQTLGDDAKAATVVSHMAVGELAFAILWTSGIALYAALIYPANVSALLFIVAASVVPMKLVGVWQLLAYGAKDFRLQSKVDLIRSAVTALIVIGLVERFGIYIVLLAPVFANVLGILVYRRTLRLPIDWNHLHRDEFKRLASIGLPNTGINIVNSSSGVQRWAERFLIHSQLGIAYLGIYAFFTWIALTLMTLTGSVMQALQPHIYDVVSRELHQKEIESYLLRPMWALSVGGMLPFGLAAAMQPDLIPMLMPDYASGLPVLHLLLLAAYLNCFYWVPAVLVFAVRFNGQAYYFLSCAFAVSVSIAIAAAMLHGGYGLISVAAGFLASQVIVGTLTLAKLWPYLFSSPNAAQRFFSQLWVPSLNVVSALVIVDIVWPLFASAATLESHVIAASIKGTAFVVLCLPTLALVERKLSIFRQHIRPYLSRN